MKNNKETTRTLDQLRAGMSADSGNTIEVMNPEVIGEYNDNWEQIIHTIDTSSQQNRSINNQLRIRRRQVLNGEYRRENYHWISQWGIGAVASVALIVSVTLWWNTLWNNNEQFVADTTKGIDFEQHEITNNIDFYTWLETQPDVIADASGS